MAITTQKRLKLTRQKYSEVVRNCKKSIAKFRDDLANDPYHAFEWAQGAIDHAGQLRVAQEIVALIDTLPKSGDMRLSPDERYTKIYEIIERQAMSKARWVPQSSSGVSNLAEQFLTAAYANALEDLRWGMAQIIARNSKKGS